MFQRTLGGGGVPHDGGWTLGLGSPIYRPRSPDTGLLSGDAGGDAGGGDGSVPGVGSPVLMGGASAATTRAPDAASHDTLSPLHIGVASAPGAAMARFSPSAPAAGDDARQPPPLALPPQRPRSASVEHTRVAQVNGQRHGGHGRGATKSTGGGGGGRGRGRRGNRRRRSGSTSGGRSDIPSPPRPFSRRSRSRSDASHGSHRSTQTPVVVVTSVEEYEAAKEQRLWQRYVALSPVRVLPPPPSIPLPPPPAPPPPPTSCVGLCLCSGCPCLALPLGRRPQEDQLRCTLETRQFTYRAGESNPLFGPLDEDGRRAVLQRDLVGELEVRPRLTSSGVPVREVDLIAANNHEANEVGAVRSTRARVRASLEP